MSLMSRRKWGYLMEYDTDAKRMERLRDLLSEGAFKTMIDSVYGLEQAPDTFARQLRPAKKGEILINFVSG